MVAPLQLEASANDYSSRSRKTPETAAAVDTPVFHTQSTGSINRAPPANDCSSRSRKIPETAAAVGTPVSRTQSTGGNAKTQELQAQARRSFVSSATIPDTHSPIHRRCSVYSVCETRACKTPDISDTSCAGKQVLGNDEAVYEKHSTEVYRARRRAVSDVSAANVNFDSDAIVFVSVAKRPPPLRPEKHKNTQYKRPGRQHTPPVSSGTAFYAHVMQQNKNAFDNRKQCHCVHGSTDQSNTASEAWTRASAACLCGSSKCQISACHTACIALFPQNRHHTSRPGAAQPCTPRPPFKTDRTQIIVYSGSLLLAAIVTPAAYTAMTDRALTGPLEAVVTCNLSCRENYVCKFCLLALLMCTLSNIALAVGLFTQCIATRRALSAAHILMAKEHFHRDLFSRDPAGVFCPPPQRAL